MRKKGVLDSIKSFLTNSLFPFGDCRNLKVDSTIIIGFLGGGKIEVGEENLSCPAVGEVKQRVAYDRIVDHIRLMPVSENQRGRGLNNDARLRIVVRNSQAMGWPLAERQGGRWLVGVSIEIRIGRIIIIAIQGIRNDGGGVDWLHDSHGKVAAVVVMVAVVVADVQGQALLRWEEKIGTATSKQRPVIAISLCAENSLVAEVHGSDRRRNGIDGPPSKTRGSN